MLTTFDRSQLVYDSLLAGASGFLLKDAPGEQLVSGVRAVVRGEELLAPRITRRLIEEFTRAGRQDRPRATTGSPSARSRCSTWSRGAGPTQRSRPSSS